MLPHRATKKEHKNMKKGKKFFLSTSRRMKKEKKFFPSRKNRTLKTQRRAG